MEFILGAAIGGAVVWFLRPQIEGWWNARKAAKAYENGDDIKPPPTP